MSDRLFTILIQGPLNQTSINGINNYKEYGDIFISSWTDCNFSLIPNNINYYLLNLPNINLTSKLVLKESTFYYAVCSMYEGFSRINTKYVIKTRSDERYSYLVPCIKEFLKDENKMVTGNIFVRKWSDIPYHIGDHIFICKTQTMLEGLRHLKLIQEGKLKEEAWADQRTNPAEVILAKAFLYGKKIDENKWNKVETFKENFSFFNINETKKFIARWNYKNISYINSFSNHHGVENTEDAVK